MSLKIVAKDSQSSARAGIFTTPHGEVRTPAFMPVATKGSVKTISTLELHQLQTEAIIANALHLFMRPGLENFQLYGGLHQFMRWDKTIFTDSGGFQIIRKSFKMTKSDKGLHFRDFFNGRAHVYTPELCMEMQKALGSDVAMLLDDCPKHDASKTSMAESIERTIAWSKRGMEHGRALGIPLLFAITQGGVHDDLRQWCTEELEKFGPDGYGIGGLSIGESKEKMIEVLQKSTHWLPENKVRYLMGVGSFMEILEAIGAGVDFFDSTFPTQCARHGTIFTGRGRYNMRGQKLEKDLRPLDEDCSCWVCAEYTRAYVNHLLREKEMLGMRLASYHNLHFTLQLVREARRAIVDGTFAAFAKEWGRIEKK